MGWAGEVASQGSDGGGREAGGSASSTSPFESETCVVKPDTQSAKGGGLLNPKAMLTPGIAGAMTALITASLSNQFNLPAKWTGLVVSALFGLMAWSSAVPLWQRCLFYVLNTLVIFSVALGANSVGTAATTGRPTVARLGEPLPDASKPRPFFHSWLSPPD